MEAITLALNAGYYMVLIAALMAASWIVKLALKTLNIGLTAEEKEARAIEAIRIESIVLTAKLKDGSIVMSEYERLLEIKEQLRADFSRSLLNVNIATF